ncbi:serine hydrolase domain-containing protein [Longispora sp. NPDC051575]|uniref:serine hydrolase domain-containing protein n=1 Tax=Longispora sp. NPDC051575 TaxID=3154943 RepID=UPI003416DB45
MTDIEGFSAPGFEAVAEAFGRNFTEYGEVGAAFAAYRDGELVVDLWGGTASPSEPWQRDTLQLIFSGTKGLAAGCVLWLVERGRLDLDAPVARYWPEFGAAGKHGITVADVLTHQSRLPGIVRPFSVPEMLDARFMAVVLAAQPPTADPRAAFIYHALTFGWLVDELVRRVDGRGVAQLFAEEFAAPLGLEVWIGLPDKLHHRATVMTAAPGALIGLPPPDDELLATVLRNPLVLDGAPEIWNSPEYRRAGMVAVGAFGTARSLARYYACLARGGELDGVRVLEEATVDAGCRERRRGKSALWGSEFAYATGFELTPDVFGPAPDAFGHAGFGGSRHAAWPAARVGFSYVMSQVRSAYPDPRPLGLLAALHLAL